MSLLGEAVEVVCRPWRVNYEIFGNTAPFLHTHVLPRYDWEPAEYLAGPASHYPRERRHDPRHQFSEEAHGQLQVQIAATLRALLTRAAS